MLCHFTLSGRKAILQFCLELAGAEPNQRLGEFAIDGGMFLRAKVVEDAVRMWAGATTGIAEISGALWLITSDLASFTSNGKFNFTFSHGDNGPANGAPRRRLLG